MKLSQYLSVMLVTALANAHQYLPEPAHIRRPDLYEAREFGEGHLGADREEIIADARNPYHAGMKPKLKKF